MDITVSDDVAVTAKHPGHLISLTVAGAVVSSQPVGGDPVDPLDGLSLPILFGEAAPSTTPAKTGVGVAGAAAVNIVVDTLEAIVNDAGSIAAGGLAVEATNDAFVLAITGGGALTKGLGSQSSVSIAGAFSIITLSMTTQAVVVGVELALTGPTGLAVNAARTGDLITASVGAAGATTAKGTAAAGSVSVNVLTNVTRATVRNVVSPAPLAVVTVTARQAGQIIAIGGGFGYGTRSGVGASVGFTRLDNTTTATIEGSTAPLALAVTGAFTVSATEESTLRSIALSAGIGTTGRRRRLHHRHQPDRQHARGRGPQRHDHRRVVGDASPPPTTPCSSPSAAPSASARRRPASEPRSGWNQVDAVVHAVLVDVTLAAIAGPVTVRATATAADAVIDGKISALAVAGGVSTGGGQGPNAAVAGALSINVVNSDIEASVTGGSIQATGAVVIDASDASTIRSLTGGFSFAGGTAAVGVGIAVNTITSAVLAALTDVAVTSGADLSVTAANTADIQTIAIGLAVAVRGGQSNQLSLSGAGSVAINTIDATTEALVSGGSLDATGDVTVAAEAATSILAIAGAISLTRERRQRGRRRHLRGRERRGHRRSGRGSTGPRSRRPRSP